MKRLFLSMIIACAAWVAGVAQDTYTVQILPTENGTVTSDKAIAEVGDIVTLTVTPAAHYQLDQLLVERELGGGGFSDDEPWGPAQAPAYTIVPTTRINDNTYTFLMLGGNVMVTATFVIIPNMRGDVNHDGVVNIADVSALIDYLLTGDAAVINVENADCNQDQVINISDVTKLIDYILSASWN